MSYYYAGSLYDTATAAANAAAYDWLLSTHPTVAEARERLAQSDEQWTEALSEYHAELESSDVERDARYESWDLSDSDYDVLRARMRELAGYDEAADELRSELPDGVEVASSDLGVTITGAVATRELTYDAATGLYNYLWRARINGAEVDVRRLAAWLESSHTAPCPQCGAMPRDVTCSRCSLVLLILPCDHGEQQRAIAPDVDGELLCDECAGLREQAREAAKELDDELPADGAKGLLAHAVDHRVMVADDWASAFLTVEAARELTKKIRECGDAPYTAEWIWERVKELESC